MPKKLDSGTVVRYCSKTKAIILDDKHQPTPSCFNLREGEQSLSVYLLEDSNQSTEIENLREVKQEMAKRHFQCKSTGLFAILDIVDSQRKFEQHERKISFEFEQADLPHCRISHNYSSEEHELYITELLVQCVKACYSIKQLEC
jgi:hypothetical protein